jgi:hypothetical protein
LNVKSDQVSFSLLKDMLSRDPLRLAAALLLYSLFYLAFFFRSLSTGNYIAPSDSLDFGVAAYLSAPALWTEGMYSGYPIAADPQSLTWYPVLYVLRGLGASWNLFIIAPYVLASATCFLLVRRMTGSNTAGAFSGFTYGFSGVMLSHIGHFNQVHAASWVPLALYGLHLVREGLKRQGAAVASIAFAMMWLAGHPQVAVYSVYLSAALVLGGLIIDRPDRSVVLARVSWSAFAIALGVGLAAISILPMMELGELSRRSVSNWELYISKALPPWQLLTIALPFAFGGFWTASGIPVPYFGLGGPAEHTGYVGLAPLVLCVAGSLAVSAYRRDLLVWIALTAVAVLLCLGDATPVGTLFFYAPGYASFRVPARHLFVVSLCVAVGSGLAFAALTRRRQGFSFIAAATLATVVAAAIGFAAFAWYVPSVRMLVTNWTYAQWALAWPLVVASALAVCALGARVLANGPGAAATFAAVLVALHVGDLTMLHYRMPGYRLQYADIQPQEAIPHPRMVSLGQELQRTGERVLAVDGSKNQFLLPNLTRPWSILAASGSGSLGIERYLDVLGMGGPGDVYPETLSTSHKGVDLFSIRYALVPQRSPMADDLRRQDGRWVALEELRYYDHDPGTHYTLFRNERARPRAWCVPEARRVTTREALAAVRSGHLPGGGEFDPARIALVETDAFEKLRRGDASAAKSDVTAYFGRQRRYLVNTSSPCLLVLSEVYYPWWRASVDEAAADIAVVNHAMVGVAVPAGSHVVRLWHAPVSIWIGGAVTVVSLLFWTAACVGGRPLRLASQTRRVRATSPLEV